MSYHVERSCTKILSETDFNWWNILQKHFIINHHMLKVKVNIWGNIIYDKYIPFLVLISER